MLKGIQGIPKNEVYSTRGMDMNFPLMSVIYIWMQELLNSIIRKKKKKRKQK